MCTIYLRNKNLYILPTQSGTLFKSEMVVRKFMSKFSVFAFCSALMVIGVLLFSSSVVWLSPGFNIRPVGKEVGSRYVNSTLQYHHFVRMYSTTEDSQIWY